MSARESSPPLLAGLQAVRSDEPRHRGSGPEGEHGAGRDARPEHPGDDAGDDLRAAGQEAERPLRRRPQPRRREVGDERAGDAVGRCHVAAVEREERPHRRRPGREAEPRVDGGEDDQARCQEPPPADAVRQVAERPREARVERVVERRRRPRPPVAERPRSRARRSRKTSAEFPSEKTTHAALSAQNGARQVAGRRWRAPRRLARGRLADGAQREHREDGRDDRDRDHLAEREPGGEEPEREERADGRPGRVHEAVVPEGRAGPVGVGRVAKEGVARRRAKALPGPVEHPRAEHPAPGRGERDERLRDVRERVAGPHEREPPVDAVRPPADDVADDLRRRSGGPLDEADRRRRARAA